MAEPTVGSAAGGHPQASKSGLPRRSSGGPGLAPAALVGGVQPPARTALPLTSAALLRSASPLRTRSRRAPRQPCRQATRCASSSLLWRGHRWLRCTPKLRAGDKVLVEPVVRVPFLACSRDLRPYRADLEGELMSVDDVQDSSEFFSLSSPGPRHSSPARFTASTWLAQAPPQPLGFCLMGVALGLPPPTRASLIASSASVPKFRCSLGTSPFAPCQPRSLRFCSTSAFCRSRTRCTLALFSRT